MQARILLFLVMGATACGGSKPAEKDVTRATAAVDAAPAPPPSRLDESKAFFAKPLETSGITEALALADALAAESSPEARLAAARIRLVAVARDIAGVASGASAESVLGDGAKSALLEVRQAAREERISGQDGARVEGAARALLIMMGDDAAEPPGLVEQRALLSGDEPEALAFRAALTARFVRAREAADSGGFDAFAASFGPFVCSSCAKPDASVMTRPAKDGSGLSCTAAADAPFCETLMRLVKTDSSAALAPNALTIAAQAIAARAGRDAKESTTLGPVLRGFASRLEPVVLPVPVATPKDKTLGAGSDGLGEAAPALIVAHVGVEGVRIGVRAVVEPEGLVRIGDDAMLSDAPRVDAEALATAEPNEETGAIAGITDRLERVQRAITNADLPGVRAPIVLAVDPEVEVATLDKVVGGILARGETSVRVLRPGTAGAVLPLWLRSLPRELEDALLPAWDKSMLVVVGEEALDVWAPEGAKEGAGTLGAELEDDLPEGLQPGWRGKSLARLRVAREAAAEGEETELSADALSALTRAVTFVSDRAKAGRVIHVVAGEGAGVTEILAVSRHLEEVGLEPAPELARVGEIWEGARCQGDGACVGAVVVALSNRDVPSSRGLTAKPTEKKEPKEPKEPAPKPEPKAAPSAQFCNQADIRSKMAKKAGSFRFCYERELQLQKDLAGRLVMRFIIGLDGGVKSAQIASNNLPNKKVGPCIKKAISKIKFKAPDGGECVVQWPFKFTAN